MSAFSLSAVKASHQTLLSHKTGVDCFTQEGVCVCMVSIENVRSHLRAQLRFQLRVTPCTCSTPVDEGAGRPTHSEWSDDAATVSTTTPPTRHRE